MFRKFWFKFATFEITFTIILGFISYNFFSGNFNFLSLNRFSNTINFYIAKFCDIQNISLVDINSDITPIVYMPLSEYETSENEIWIEVKSSREIDSSEHKFVLNESNDIYYVYQIYVNGLQNGINDVKMSFLVNNNTIRKNVRIKKIEDKILGICDGITEEFLSDGNDLLTVVDKCFALPFDWVPNDLMPISDYGIPVSSASKKFLLRKIAIMDLYDLINDAKDEGINLIVLSAYRSYDEQYELYKNRLAIYGEVYTNESTASPGHSEHQLGTAVDLASFYFESGKMKISNDINALKWLKMNSYKYGFVISYPEGSSGITGIIYEPWHIRYVGKKNALEIFDSSIVPIEYMRNKILANK